ncbi:TusE/DsrC/DsvC family sulfur relay protein [Chloroflexota bacterium]
MFGKQTRQQSFPELDQDGFLLDAGKWTKEVAEILVKEELPKGLAEDHWRVIDYLRKYFLEFESVPPVRMLVRETGLSLRELKELFPSGLSNCACRVAGIPSRVLTKYPR